MESCGTSSKAEGTTDFRCVQCGFPTKILYIQYSPGNIRLMKCENCKAVADEYTECELMILIIDLILHKLKAYRHLFYNMSGKETVNFESLLWKSALMCLILDVYRIWVLSTNETEWHGSVSVASLLQELGKMLTSVIIGNLTFLVVVLYATRKFFSTSAGLHGIPLCLFVPFPISVYDMGRGWRHVFNALSLLHSIHRFIFILKYKFVELLVLIIFDILEIKRWKQVLFAVLVSSYFKIFLMATMVWEFPSSVVFIIDIFVISSNTVALKVITNSATVRCLGVCTLAHGVKFGVSIDWSGINRLQISSTV